MSKVCRVSEVSGVSGVFRLSRVSGMSGVNLRTVCLRIRKVDAVLIHVYFASKSSCEEMPKQF